MMSTRIRVASAVVALGALGGAAVVTAPAAVATSPDLTITAFLRAPHPVALARLASAHGLSHAQRVQQLRRLVPSAAARSTVARTLTSAGLHVSGQTAWSISAHGQSSVIARMFGTRPAATTHPTPAQRLAENGPLPLVPAALSSYVAFATPTRGGPAVFHHSEAVPLNGTDFRNAYTAANVPPPGGGATDDAGSTIATLQLSTYDDSDLTKYAAMQTPPLPNIVGTAQYHPVNVDGGTTDSSGDVEVDLDQESILSTAPSATQRPYFAPNSDAGFNDVFAHVFDDVVQNAQATDGGDPNIVALSSSWGLCESGTGAKSIAETETLIEALVAAGVTVFSSSGDDGIYDCGDDTQTGLGNTQADVDYPASSPFVVGVGGTNLQYTGTATAPNDGSNWTENSWTCHDPVSCQSTIPPTIPILPGGTGGTGGGESGSAYDSTTADSFAGFPAPAYQTATIKKPPFAGQTKRLVPDIAADGDPDTGFEEYTSDSTYTPLEDLGDGFLQVGGTSLSSPISAALLTNSLATADRHTGVGDIHAALYSAWKAKVGATRDVIAGKNGATVDKGTDPSVTAKKGYDSNSGIGGVLWPAVVPFLLNTGKPTVTGRLALKNRHNPKHPDEVTVHWRGHQGDDEFALASSSVIVSKLGSSKPVYSVTNSPTHGRTTFTGKPGRTYQLTVTTTDIGGQESTPATSRVLVPIDDSAFHFKGGWERKRAARAFGGSYHQTNDKGATARIAATGTQYVLRAPTGPNRGKLAVYLGSKRIKTIDLYASVPRKQSMTIYGGPTTPRARRVFTFRCLGKHSPLSGGKLVTVDSLAVSY
jgi:hypothetical protein